MILSLLGSKPLF